jgi:hypothetical protein
VVLDIDQFALQKLAVGKKRALLLHLDILDMDGPEPASRIICAMPRASFRSVLLRLKEDAKVVTTRALISRSHECAVVLIAVQGKAASRRPRAALDRSSARRLDDRRDGEMVLRLIEQRNDRLAAY